MQTTLVCRCDLSVHMEIEMWTSMSMYVGVSVCGSLAPLRAATVLSNAITERERRKRKIVN